MEQEDDMENIRRRIDRKRQESQGLSERDARKNDLCNKIQQMKNSFAGLRDRINALQDTDPDMATYIRKLEAISEDFHTPVAAPQTQTAAPEVLEKIAQRILDAESRNAKLRQDLREQEDVIKELRDVVKKYASSYGQTQASAQTQASVQTQASTPASPPKPAKKLDWEGFDGSALNAREPELDVTAYMRQGLEDDMRAEALFE